MGKHLEQALPSVYTLQCLTGKVDNNNNNNNDIVCRAAQEAVAPHREYINRKKENEIFTPM